MPITKGGTGAGTANTARSNLGLTIGTAAGNIIALDTSARLPAVDGSQLKNLPTSSGTITLTGDVTGSGTGNFATTIAGGAVTDASLGNRTIDQTITTAISNIGTLTQLLSWMAKVLSSIIGKTNWFDAPDTTLATAATHIASTSNPHNVTPAQLGLAIGSNVQAWNASLDTISQYSVQPFGTQLLTKPDAPSTLSQLGVTVSSGATIADVRGETDATKAITPAVQWYHPGVAKAWVHFTVASGVVTIQASYLVTSVTRTTTGTFTIAFAAPMQTSTYFFTAQSFGTTAGAVNPGTMTASSLQMRFYTSAALADPARATVAVWS
ncbi:MAG: hypothetical protein ICV63_14320 [Coleofasciculus sp. Co-bin14]|nr:hypothetical protein [Coleofasciculus sp. Co-bin14]